MTPSTPSGRRLLDLATFKDGRKWPVIEISPEFLACELDNIECEAVEAYRLDLAARIEGLREHAQRQGTWGIEYGDDQFMAAVLRLIEGEKPRAR